MAYTGFQQLVFQLLQENELNGASAYQIMPPAGGNSTWSFGTPQFDVGGNAIGYATLDNILLTATNSSGNYTRQVHKFRACAAVEPVIPG